MKREELKANLEILDMAYEKFFINPTLFDIWYDCCKDCDAEIFKHAVRMYMKTCEYAPTIAGVLRCYNDIKSYRTMIKELIISQYNVMRNVWEEPFDEPTLFRFRDIVFTAPKEKREGLINDIVNHAISFHNDCSYEAKTPPTLYHYLEGIT